MAESIHVRVNGRGNAWPVFVGTKHPFYNSNSSDDLANASYSIIGMRSTDFDLEQIEWSVLVDAGNHTTPYIIKNENRIPEAIVLTHAHMDHILGIEWIAQSNYYLSRKKKKYPVYGSRNVIDIFRQTFPHLKDVVACKELLPGQLCVIDEVEGLAITAFPVFHGEGGIGASMLFFESIEKESSFLFTGDMLCPLLRKKDFAKLKNAQFAFIDTNNRFPYPLGNHGSVVKFMPDEKRISPHYAAWLDRAKFTHLIAPHSTRKYDSQTHSYFDEFLQDYQAVGQLPLCILDFAQHTSIPLIHLIHYGGFEDSEFYQQKVLSGDDLEKWANTQASDCGLQNTTFRVPAIGEHIKLV